MQFRRYSITLRHDAGKIKIATVSTRMSQAVRQILNAERAPFSAVVKIEKGEAI